MVSSLLKMKTTMDLILNESFARNDSFTLALKEAFEHFINQRQNKCEARIPSPFRCLAQSPGLIPNDLLNTQELGHAGMLASRPSSTSD